MLHYSASMLKVKIPVRVRVRVKIKGEKGWSYG
jgi:hypothetical protein